MMHSPKLLGGVPIISPPILWLWLNPATGSAACVELSLNDCSPLLYDRFIRQSI